MHIHSRYINWRVWPIRVLLGRARSVVDGRRHMPLPGLVPLAVLVQIRMLVYVQIQWRHLHRIIIRVGHVATAASATATPRRWQHRIVRNAQVVARVRYRIGTPPFRTTILEPRFDLESGNCQYYCVIWWFCEMLSHLSVAQFQLVR